MRRFLHAHARRLPFALLLAFAAVSCWPVTPLAAADLVITGGYLERDPYSGPLELRGERGFTFRGGPQSGIFQPVEDCNAGSAPCGPGDRISLHANWSSGDLPGVATLDGITYMKVGGDLSSLTVDFNGSVTMPPFSPSATIAAPFVFNGRFTHDGIREELIGSGVVTLSLMPHLAIPGRWRIEYMLYELGAMLPSPWTSRDIGAVGLAGRSSILNDTMVVAGAGADIWGTADAFRFTYQPISVNGTITAKVSSQEKAFDVPSYGVATPHPLAKAGVIIRESTSPSAASVILDVKPSGGLEFMARYSSGEATTYLGGASTPDRDVWLQLALAGSNQITAAYSLDGVTWIPVGTVSMAFGTTDVLAGLAVTSHDPAVLHAALFQDARVSGAAHTRNLLARGDFEDYEPPALGPPGWVSDDLLRQVPAKSETHQPRSGAKNGACWTTTYLDCGIYQEVVAQVTGSYNFRIYASADRGGGFVGANVNGVTAASTEVEPAPFGVYALYTLTFTAKVGDVVRVWMYSPPSPGYVVIDDASLVMAGESARVVTGGTWTIQGIGSPFGSFDLTGSGFSVQGTYEYGVVEPLDFCRSGCTARTFFLRSSFANATPSNLMSFARGTTTFGRSTGAPWVEYGGVITLNGGMVTLPTPTGTEWPQLVSASAPFTMSGVLRGYDVVGVREPRLLFEVPLTGSGMATLEMLAHPNASGQILLTFYRLNYEFNPIAALQTSEP